MGLCFARFVFLTFRGPLASHDSNPYPKRSRIERYNATKGPMSSWQCTCEMRRCESYVRMYKGAPLRSQLMLSMQCISSMYHGLVYVRGGIDDFWFLVPPWCAPSIPSKHVLRHVSNKCVYDRAPLMQSSDPTWHGRAEAGQRIGEASHPGPADLPTPLEIELASGVARALNLTDIRSRGVYRWQTDVKPRLVVQDERALS